MLQLKHLKLIRDLTDVPVHEIKPVKFGFEINYTAATTYVLASQLCPSNMAMLILRVQSYMTNILTTASDFQFYRTMPTGQAWWILANDTSSTSLQEWTNDNAPVQLATDADEMLLFPPGAYANLLFLATNAAPAGTWRMRTTVFAYFVPPEVSDVLGGPQSWISVS
jgi:hypothetical protein